jgi:caa(3)-type oxidase subunit IV
MAHEAHAAGHEEHGAHEAHEHPNYVKIWALLLVLLCISVIGPMFGIKAVTIITAFGIAVYKAYLVAKNFMHINFERPYITYLMVTCLVFMLLFFAGASPDVMKKEGTNWEKPAWKAAAAAHAAGAHEAARHGGH